jgi:hypothetical protein
MRLKEAIETQMLEQYLAEVGGRIYAEVPIGRHPNSHFWSQPCAIRRIDGVRVPLEPSETSVVHFQSNHSDFLAQIQQHVPELIEVKGGLNRGVIGQVLVAENLFKAQYKVPEVKLVVICKRGDSALEWACQERNIKVVKVT